MMIRALDFGHPPSRTERRRVLNPRSGADRQALMPCPFRPTVLVPSPWLMERPPCCLDPLGRRWLVVSTGSFSGRTPDACLVQGTTPPEVDRVAASSQRMRDALRVASARREPPASAPLPLCASAFLHPFRLPPHSSPFAPRSRPPPFHTPHSALRIPHSYALPIRWFPLSERDGGHHSVRNHSVFTCSAPVPPSSATLLLRASAFLLRFRLPIRPSPPHVPHSSSLPIRGLL